MESDGGHLGLRMEEIASWDVDEAQGCGGWIVWQILGRYDLTLPRSCAILKKVATF